MNRLDFISDVSILLCGRSYDIELNTMDEYTIISYFADIFVFAGSNNYKTLYENFCYIDATK